MHAVIVPRRSCLTDCVFFVKLINSFIQITRMRSAMFGHRTSFCISDVNIALIFIDTACGIFTGRGAADCRRRAASGRLSAVNA